MSERIQVENSPAVLDQAVAEHQAAAAAVEAARIEAIRQQQIETWSNPPQNPRARKVATIEEAREVVRASNENLRHKEVYNPSLEYDASVESKPANSYFPDKHASYADVLAHTAASNPQGYKESGEQARRTSVEQHEDDLKKLRKAVKVAHEDQLEFVAKDLQGKIEDIETAIAARQQAEVDAKRRAPYERQRRTNQATIKNEIAGGMYGLKPRHPEAGQPAKTKQASAEQPSNGPETVTSQVMPAGPARRRATSAQGAPKPAPEVAAQQATTSAAKATQQAGEPAATTSEAVVPSKQHRRAIRPQGPPQSAPVQESIPAGRFEAPQQDDNTAAATSTEGPSSQQPTQPTVTEIAPGDTTLVADAKSKRSGKLDDLKDFTWRKGAATVADEASAAFLQSLYDADNLATKRTLRGKVATSERLREGRIDEIMAAYETAGRPAVGSKEATELRKKMVERLSRQGRIRRMGKQAVRSLAAFGEQPGVVMAPGYGAMPTDAATRAQRRMNEAAKNDATPEDDQSTPTRAGLIALQLARLMLNLDQKAGEAIVNKSKPVAARVGRVTANKSKQAVAKAKQTVADRRARRNANPEGHDDMTDTLANIGG